MNIKLQVIRKKDGKRDDDSPLSLQLGPKRGKERGQTPPHLCEQIKSGVIDDPARGGGVNPCIICLDELDTFVKNRSDSNFNTDINNQIIGQLLSLLDGIESLNDVILIGGGVWGETDKNLSRGSALRVHLTTVNPKPGGGNEGSESRYPPPKPC